MSAGVIPKGRRPWLRYSLRTFLLVISLVAGWVGVVVNRARTQREAVDQIERAGGNLTYDYHEVAPRTWSSAGRPREPEWLRRVLGQEYFDRPNKINLENPSDEGWAESLNKLPSVKYLLLVGEHVSDKAISRLSDLTNLWELQLTNASISDEGLKHFGQFRKLRWLVIDNAKITDAGIANLAALHDLEELCIWRTPLTEAAVPHLSRLRGLTKLDIRGSGISDASADELRKALPNCKVRK